MDATQPAALRMVQLHVRAQHLGGSHSGTELPAQAAERPITDPRHRRKHYAGSELMGTDLDHGSKVLVVGAAMVTATVATVHVPALRHGAGGCSFTV